MNMTSLLAAVEEETVERVSRQGAVGVEAGRAESWPLLRGGAWTRRDARL